MSIEQLTGRRFLVRAARVFKALADENRLGLLLMLNRDCRCVRGCDVGGEKAQQTLEDAGKRLGISKPTVSHHLKQLSQAGLIACTRSGRRVECRIDLDPLREILAAIGARQLPAEDMK